MGRTTPNVGDLWVAAQIKGHGLSPAPDFIYAVADGSYTVIKTSVSKLHLGLRTSACQNPPGLKNQIGNATAFSPMD